MNRGTIYLFSLAGIAVLLRICLLARGYLASDAEHSLTGLIIVLFSAGGVSWIVHCSRIFRWGMAVLSAFGIVIAVFLAVMLTIFGIE